MTLKYDFQNRPPLAKAFSLLRLLSISACLGNDTTQAITNPQKRLPEFTHQLDDSWGSCDTCVIPRLVITCGLRFHPCPSSWVDLAGQVLGGSGGEAPAALQLQAGTGAAKR